MIESGELVIVGVNRYVGEPEPEGVLHRLDPALERRQVDRVQALRATRDAEACERQLSAVLGAAHDPAQNVLLPMRAALAARCTIGEVCGVLRSAWGTHDASLG